MSSAPVPRTRPAVAAAAALVAAGLVAAVCYWVLHLVIGQ